MRFVRRVITLCKRIYHPCTRMYIVVNTYLPVWRHPRARWRSQLDHRSRRKKTKNRWPNRRNRKQRTIKKKNNNYECENNKRQYMDVTAAGILAPGHVYSIQTTRMNPYTFFFLLDYNIWPAKALEMSKCFPSTTATPTTTSSVISRPRIRVYVYAYNRLKVVKEKRKAVVFKFS